MCVICGFFHLLSIAKFLGVRGEGGADGFVVAEFVKLGAQSIIVFLGEATTEFEVGGDFWLESFVAESGEGVGVVFAGESEVFDEGLWLAVGVVVDLKLGSGECFDGEVGSPVEGVGVAVVVVVSDCSVELVGGVFCSGLGVGAGECFVGDDTVGDEVEVSGWIPVVDGDVGGDDGVVGGEFFGVVLGLRVAFGGDLCCHFVDDEVQHC